MNDMTGTLKDSLQLPPHMLMFLSRTFGRKLRELREERQQGRHCLDNPSLVAAVSFIQTCQRRLGEPSQVVAFLQEANKQVDCLGYAAMCRWLAERGVCTTEPTKARLFKRIADALRVLGYTPKEMEPRIRDWYSRGLRPRARSRRHQPAAPHTVHGHAA